MKRLLLVAFMGIALSSCTKSYTCTCTSVKPNGTVIDVNTRSITDSKDNSEEKCRQFDNVNGDVTTTCLIDEKK